MAQSSDLDAVLTAWSCAPELGVHLFARLRALQRLDAWDIEVVRLLPALLTSSYDQLSFPELVRAHTRHDLFNCDVRVFC